MLRAARVLRGRGAVTTYAPPRGQLFRRDAPTFMVLVGCAPLVSGLLQLLVSYRTNQETLMDVQRAKAPAAAARIEQFVAGVRDQLAWSVHPAGLLYTEPLAQQQADYWRLLRQVPAITTLRYLDPSGHEQLWVSRDALDTVGSQTDYSQDASFLAARGGRTYYGSVYFEHSSEPYMTIAAGGAAPEVGVTVAEVNLKLIWDVVASIQAGQAGYAYVVDGQGRLVAHPDISLVLQRTN